MSAVEVTVAGVRYVPEDDLRAAQDVAGDLRRTLAMVHMHLVLDSPGMGRERAVSRIQHDQGWTIDDARAVAGVISWALSESTS